MAVASLYRRILPSPPAIEFASSEGKCLFSEALQGGTMEGFFRLISYFQTQSEPAYCGLASLSVVLNALAIDPGRKWKGPWRWFDESMLDCCEPLEKVKAEGITFGKVACLAHCAGAKVEAFRTNQSTIDEFRKYVMQCASSEESHMIASYHRKHFKQTGTGHFSPIGGYHAGRDMALILDVARFKYPPHWVPLTLLWEAMNTIDEATGCPRGFMLISRLQKAPLLYTLSCRHESWLSMAKYLVDEVPILLKSETLDSVPAVLSLFIKSLPSSAGDFIKWVAEVRRQEEGGSTLSNEEKARLALKEEVLRQVHDTELFKVIKELLLSSASPCCLNLSSSSDNDSLPEIAANICCQGAALLTGNFLMREGICCKGTCLKCLKNNGDGHATIVSGTVVSGGNKQGVDVLVPVSPAKPVCCSGLSSCTMMHPASNDVLTVLLLALPPRTWSDIKDQRLSDEIQGLVSTDKLPDLLHDEVLHLRQQLHFLKRCKDKEVDNDPVVPSSS
ncbi:glutathione gamma-glutamylcysteinyltransferase 1-like isoform X2 [Ananas comosus]|uniref:glutathione gamma-glutamylcysteinyltransferase n=1 Tax=Ananas comosus TaxID=4615 RepID=A0A6P5EED4_ANACO|nr:glutathione gamma-glutamylcysteinyltransferase 1-like isoform X1 [Ananas comosus]XP_020079891.1 glutathione gamma-glutamylcysteinyltransferase 1-like isoform X2 [Ananas comosus]